MEASSLSNSELILCIVELTNMFSHYLQQNKVIRILEERLKPSVNKKTIFSKSNVSLN